MIFLSSKEIKKSFQAAIWFMLLTFPVMVIKVNTIDNVVEWRWNRMFIVGVGVFFLSFLWRFILKRRESETKGPASEEMKTFSFVRRILREKRFFIPAVITGSIFIRAPKLNRIIHIGFIIVTFGKKGRVVRDCLHLASAPWPLRYRSPYNRRLLQYLIYNGQNLYL